MNTINILTLLFILHFIGDFLFQTRQMANNKSKSLYWLTSHVLYYCSAFMPIFLLIGIETQYIEFMFVLFTTHWLTDFFTSKLTTYCWEKRKIKMFFVVIGFDQMIHVITLLYIYKYLIRPYVFI